MKICEVSELFSMEQRAFGRSLWIDVKSIESFPSFDRGEILCGQPNESGFRGEGTSPESFEVKNYFHVSCDDIFQADFI